MQIRPSAPPSKSNRQIISVLLFTSLLISAVVTGKNHVVLGVLVGAALGIGVGVVAFRMGFWRRHPAARAIASSEGTARIWSLFDRFLGIFIRNGLMLVLGIYLSRTSPEWFALPVFVAIAVVDASQDATQAILVALKVRDLPNRDSQSDDVI